jgi:transcription antitermination factor NusG
MSQPDPHTNGASHEPAIVPAIPLDLPGRWYVAHSRARNEKILAKQLTRLGIFNYLPLMRRRTRSPVTRRISQSMVPVFPGYVFFNGGPDQRYLCLRTNRVANVLDVSNQDQLVSELLHIQLLLAKNEAFLVTPRLQVGDWGRIIAGPLRGLEGVVTHCSGRLRLSMNVTILGQSVNVEVDRDVVEPIDPPAYLLQARRRRSPTA